MKILKLEIKRADGSLYWTEHFNESEKMEEWLANEKSRPYWDPTYITEVIDSTPPPPTQEELDAIAAEKSDLDQNKRLLRGLKKSDLIDVDACAGAIMKIIKYLRTDK